jgi:hypothetical protein
MKPVFHVGMHKSGTSALQGTFFRSRGPAFPDHDCARVRAGRLAPPPAARLSLSDVVGIDPAARRGILDRLAGSPWGRRRRDWIAGIGTP